MTLYHLIIKEGIDYDVTDDLLKAKVWWENRTGVEVVFEVLTVDLPLRFKEFGVRIGNGSVLWGLDGIKQQLRDKGFAPYGKYHVVTFLYELRGFDLGSIAAWSYPNHLNGAAFCEIPSLLSLEKSDNLFRLFTHEWIHCAHRLAWWKGVPTKDTMDLYDKEFNVNALDGNRARNLTELAPHWSKITQLPISKMVEWIKEQLLAILSKLRNMANEIPKVRQLALAIQQYEGWVPPNAEYPLGSRSYRNNNPGNLRYTSYTASLGAVRMDDKNFCVFQTYEAGFDALCQFLQDAANGLLRPYRIFPSGAKRPPLTLIDFFGVYAPSWDKNEPNAYALFVANRLKVDPTTLVKDLV